MNGRQRQSDRISPVLSQVKAGPSCDGPSTSDRLHHAAASSFGQWLTMGLFAVVALMDTILCGCGHLKTASEIDIVSPTRSPEAYIAFWSENKRFIDMIYADDYAPYPIIVDTASGSRDILSLIDPEAVRPLVNQIISERTPPDQAVLRCHRYVLSQFQYTPFPDLWPTIEQTLQQRFGDCKGLSLLLMSMLIAADVDASAEISNGHMWVRVTVLGTTSILETDQAPERRLIYDSPGFYDRPLLKIVSNQTLRRKRK